MLLGYSFAGNHCAKSYKPATRVTGSLLGQTVYGKGRQSHIIVFVFLLSFYL